MQYSVGDSVSVRINKIQENGCYCSFYPLILNKFGFMPKKLMPSFYDENGNIIRSKGDDVVAVINHIGDNGFITLSDVAYYKNQQKKKKEKSIQKQHVETFASEFKYGTIFEVEVFQVQSSRVIIKIGDLYGIINKEDTDWNEIGRLEDLLFKGEIIKAVYLKYENGKLFFSLKLLNKKPYDENLYDFPLSDLLKYAGHKSNVFIGQAKRYHYGLFIENLYSVSDDQRGKLLIDPVYGYNLRAIVPNANFNVEENKYYKIELRLAPKNKRLERNQLFQFAAINVEETENPYKTDVNLTFEKFTSPAGNVATAHLLAEVGKNMYSSKDRMFFELIQNADDAAASNGVLVNVKTLGDYLIVCHNGNSFDKDDFEAITSAANGTKKANEKKTGYKGIGFKSVFTDSEKVFIKTGGYQFKFDKSDERFTDFDSFYFCVNRLQTEEEQQLFLRKYNSERTRFKGVTDIPWQLEPIWIDKFPTELGEDFIRSNVAIALKLGEHKIKGDNGYEKAITDIISNPHFMLFLRNTKRIDFNGLSVSKTNQNGIITLKNSFDINRIEYFKRTDFEIDVSNDIFERNGIDIRIAIEERDDVSGKIIEAKFVDTHNQELDNIPKKIAINNSTIISFAIPIGEDKSLKPNTKRNEISMFAFLPTLVKDFKFPFYINANFILDPPRQRILGDNPWNFYLMQAIAKRLVRWSASLNEEKDKNALNVLLPLYFEEDSTDTKQLAEHFNTAYKSALESEAFILNNKGELSTQDEIVIDKTGLSEIVGADLFCKILQTEKCLPAKYIDSQILEEDIFEKVELLKFDDVIEAITDNNTFNEWFITATDEQKLTLYKWIIDNNNTTSRTNELNSFVSNLPLFQFGEEYKSCGEIEASDYIITTENILPIREILSRLDFVCSDNVFDENHSLYEFIKPQDDEKLFNAIKECDFSELTNDERKTLFFALEDFDGVGEAKLKAISLFRNMNGGFKTLDEMIAYRENVPKWLYSYVICKDDNDKELTKYLISQEYEFKSIIQEHYEDIDTSLAELYNSYKYEWTGSFTRQIIDKYEIDNEILTIIEESDTETKKYFLNSIKKLELHSTFTYKKDSYEYRVLQLVLSIYEEPSEFSQKIYFDEKCIKDFSVSDEVICDFVQNREKKKVKMSLAKLLPQYQNQSDSIEKIKALFESKKGLDKFFVAKPKSIYDIHKELNQLLGIPESYFSEWNVVGNAQQYLFATYYRRHWKNWNNLYVPKIVLGKEKQSFLDELLDFLYDNNISITESPFTYHLKTYFIGKYFDSNYLLESEQLLPTIEQWADDDKKKKYLTDNGVRTSNCNTIQFRKLFLENKPVDFIDKLSDSYLKCGINFITEACGSEKPFAGANQKEILIQLKDKKCCGLSDNWNDKRIKEFSKEWNSKEYNEWIKEHYPHIFIYPEALPRQLSYDGKILLNYDDSEYNYYYDRQTKQLYLCNSRKIEDILFEVAKEGKSDLSLDEYRKLCLEGKVSVSKEDIEEKNKTIENLSEENRKKDEIIELYRAKYGELIDEDFPKDEERQVSQTNFIENIYSNVKENLLQLGKVIERGGLSDDEQVAAHKEAVDAIIMKLEKNGYDCSNWNLDISNNKHWRSFNQVEDIVNPEGEKINLVVKSAKGGYLYLSATDFEFLTSNRKNLLMVWDGKNEPHSVTANDIFSKDSNVNLIFDTEYTPKHYYAALSKVFQYIKRTTFAVKNPCYNAYDSIKSFGMDSKTDGVQELFDDNDL